MALYQKLFILSFICTVLCLESAEKKASPIKGNGNNKNQKLIVAVKSKRAKEVRALLEQGADPNAYDGADRTKKTALMWAIIKKDMAVVQQLIAFQANLDLQDTLGATPLRLAIVTLQPEMVRFLLDQGADPFVVDTRGETVFDWLDVPRGEGTLKPEDHKKLHEIHGVLEDYLDYADQMHAAAQKAGTEAPEWLPPATIVSQYLVRYPRKPGMRVRKRNGNGGAGAGAQQRVNGR